MSGATAAATMVSVILVTGWLAGGLGPAGFAVYALSRRVLSAAASVAPGPLGVALARAIAAAPDGRTRDAQLWAGTLLAFGATATIVAVGAAFPAFWADLLLSDARYAPELLATLGLIVGNTVYSLVFARLRGASAIGPANLWQLWVLAIGPLVVAGFLARRGPVLLVLLLLTAVSLTALVPLLAWLGRAAHVGVRSGDLRQPLRGLLRYSVPRVPGTAALACLLAIGPLLAPYLGDLTEAGHLVAAQSVLRVAEVGTVGFGLVVLPRVSVIQSQRQDEFLRERVEDLVALVLHLGLFAACQLAIWAPEIVRVWLGVRYAEAIPLIRVLLIALVPYLSYTLLRSVIDGMEERPVNTLNLYAALACTTVLSLVLGAGGLGAFGLALATAAGLVVLGGMTVGFLWRRLGMRGASLHAASAVGLNVTAVLATLAIRPLLVPRLGQPGLLAAGIAVSGVLLLMYLLALRRLEVRWLFEIERRLLRRDGNTPGR